MSSFEYNKVKPFSNVSLIFCLDFSISNDIFAKFFSNSLFLSLCCFRVRASLSDDVIETDLFKLAGSKLAAPFSYPHTLKYLPFGMAEKRYCHSSLKAFYK